MAIVTNQDRLEFVLTQYGLSRIAEAMADSTVELNLYKVKLGDSNGVYYKPSENQADLVHPIPNGEFYISHKELLEDNLTVDLEFSIPESFGGYDIREVGLYETIDGVDNLFAIGTQQPIVKPSTSANYYILVDYHIMLKTANLAEVYEQIVLNPVQAIVTAQDFQNLISSVLFTQGNLSEQISGNSHIIGLNRATTLYEIIMKNTSAYSCNNVVELYSNIASLCKPINIFGLWSFNYPKKNSDKASIVDISPNQHNMSTNKGVNLYPLKYVGLSSTLGILDNNYFYIPPEMPLTLTDSDNKDVPFTFIATLSHSADNKTRTILARSNYAVNTHAFEINELPAQRLEIKLFTDANNYITFTTEKGTIPLSAHSILLSYDNVKQEFIGYIGGKQVFFNKKVTGTYTHISTTPTELYGFTCDSKRVIYANSSTSSVSALYNADGTPYTGGAWSVHSGAVFYETDLATYDRALNKDTDYLYSWVYGANIVYTKELDITKDTKLYNKDFTEYTGASFRVSLNDEGTGYVVKYGAEIATNNTSDDIMPYTIYAWSFSSGIEKIWANSNTNPSILFYANGNLYTGDDWSIINNQVVFVTGAVATYNSEFNITVPSLGVTSYTTQADGTNVNFIDSYVGLLAFITNDSINGDNLRQLSLRLESMLGNNPCMFLSQ